jgi:alanyl-tRNA synthetase
VGNKSLRVIADHIRACSFLIADGVLPGNEGRGYVLRRIIRRAIRHGYKLGTDAPFFYKLARSLETQMGAAYPELGAQREHVERVLRQEEERFAETLDNGMRILEAAIEALPQGGEIPGETAFKLYDTYGFPEDLTADVARERNLAVDHAGFAQAMEQQRARARESSQFVLDRSKMPRDDTPTPFVGYDTLETQAKVIALYTGTESVSTLAAGTAGIVVLESTPFYAEGGGQVGDTGVLEAPGLRFEVDDTQKLGIAYGHLGRVVEGQLDSGAMVTARVDAARRSATVLHHSATHLLHAALRQVLGKHVQQKGSLVAPDRLRFDFSHYEAVSPAELKEIERLVNAQVRANAPAETREMEYDQAITAGALAFFGEKYADTVRVLNIGEFSTELCGGTHVRRAGDIGTFKIIAENGIASGVRRIEAVTGHVAEDWIEANDQRLKEIATLIKSGRDDVADKVGQLVERTRGLERELESLRGKLASGGGRDLIEQAVEIAGVQVLAARLDGADSKALRTAADQLKDRLGSGVVVLGAVENDKVRLVAGVTKDLTGRLKAGELIRPVAEHVGGRGGGRPDFAQAGGDAPDKLDAALALVAEHVRAALG